MYPQYKQVMEIEEKKHNKIAIVGGGKSLEQAPFNDTEWEIWTCGALLQNCPRVDLYIEIHNEKCYTEIDKKIIQPFMKKQLKKPRELNKSNFPLHLIIEKYGRIACASSLSYLTAFAMEEGVKELRIYGCDFISKQEKYSKQAQSLLWLCGIAKGSGIKVEITGESDLAWLPYIYGYEDVMENTLNMRFEKIISSLENKRRDSIIELYNLIEVLISDVEDEEKRKKLQKYTLKIIGELEGRFSAMNIINELISYISHNEVSNYIDAL